MVYDINLFIFVCENCKAFLGEELIYNTKRACRERIDLAVGDEGVKMALTEKKNMETTEFNERESLALISKMIEATKEQMDTDRWNPFIVWGLFTMALGIVIYTIVMLTGNPRWNWLWFLMFVFWIGYALADKRRPKRVVTYNSRAIDSVWKALGILFAMTPVTFTVMTLFLDFYPTIMNMIMPLTLIYIGIGVSFTGIMLREPLIVYIPIAGMISPFVMISAICAGQFTMNYLLLFCLSFFVMMVVPGLILNYKTRHKQ